MGRRSRGFGVLRPWHVAEAKAQSIPPYVIFHDTVLRCIAAVRPVTVEELGEIKGVGADKQQRYGARVLAVLAEAAASRPPPPNGHRRCLPGPSKNRPARIKAGIQSEDVFAY
jgi:ribonuclease D